MQLCAAAEEPTAASACLEATLSDTDLASELSEVEEVLLLLLDSDELASNSETESELLLLPEAGLSELVGTAGAAVMPAACPDEAEKPLPSAKADVWPLLRLPSVLACDSEPNAASLAGCPRHAGALLPAGPASGLVLSCPLTG